MSSNVVYAGSHVNWEFVYENDKNGNVVSGDINNLINAINQGADVKMLGYSITAGVYTVLSNVVGVTPTNIVYVKHITYPSSADSNGIPYLIEDRKQVQLFRSDGKREILQYNLTGDTITRHNTITHAMKWYVNK